MTSFKTIVVQRLTDLFIRSLSWAFIMLAENVRHKSQNNIINTTWIGYRCHSEFILFVLFLRLC